MCVRGRGGGEGGERGRGFYINDGKLFELRFLLREVALNIGLEKKSETTTAGVPKQDANTKKFKKNAVY